MAVVAEKVAAAPLVDGSQTALHSHAGGGGANVKAGLVAGLVDNGSAAVTFGAAFAATPRVVASLTTYNNNGADIVRTTDVTTTGFTVAIFKGHSGGSHTWDVAWIATDAGS